MRSRTTILGLAGSAALAAVLACAAPACAQVIQIGDDGRATTLNGPVQITDSGARPLAPSAPERPASRRDPAFEHALSEAAQGAQISDALIAAVAWQESRMNQAAVSRKGARGVMQLMPATAAGLGVDPGDLGQNLHGGAAYLARLLKAFDGDVVLALAAYNAGPEAVRRYGGVPPYPETRAYVAAVLDRLARTQASASIPGSARNAGARNSITSGQP